MKSYAEVIRWGRQSINISFIHFTVSPNILHFVDTTRPRFSYRNPQTAQHEPGRTVSISSTSLCLHKLNTASPVYTTMYKEHPEEKMLACQYMGPKTMVVNSVPKPMITAPKDAIVKITHCTVCGSDLHMCELRQWYRHSSVTWLMVLCRARWR